MDEKLYVVIARHEDGTIYSTSRPIPEREVPDKVYETAQRWRDNQHVEVFARQAHGALVHYPMARVVGGVPR